MPRKIILWLTVLVVMAGWPISFINDPPKMEIALVWQVDDSEKEKDLLFQKLALDASLIKRIFYNSKATITSERYTRNILGMVNLNNYFFNNHPEADPTEANHRMKFPYPSIIGFLTGAYLSVKKKKHFKLWIGGCVIVLLLSFFKKMDGWDMAVYPPMGIIIFEGLKEINKRKFGWILLTLITTVSLLEIGRLFL